MLQGVQGSQLESGIWLVCTDPLDNAATAMTEVDNVRVAKQGKEVGPTLRAGNEQNTNGIGA
jgi:hypothetical protein